MTLDFKLMAMESPLLLGQELINDGCGIHLLVKVPEDWLKKLEPMEMIGRGETW